MGMFTAYAPNAWPEFDDVDEVLSSYSEAIDDPDFQDSVSEAGERVDAYLSSATDSNKLRWATHRADGDFANLALSTVGLSKPPQLAAKPLCSMCGERHWMNLASACQKQKDRFAKTGLVNADRQAIQKQQTTSRAIEQEWGGVRVALMVGF